MLFVGGSLPRPLGFLCCCRRTTTGLDSVGSFPVFWYRGGACYWFVRKSAKANIARRWIDAFLRPTPGLPVHSRCGGRTHQTRAWLSAGKHLPGFGKNRSVGRSINQSSKQTTRFRFGNLPPSRHAPFSEHCSCADKIHSSGGSKTKQNQNTKSAKQNRAT